MDEEKKNFFFFPFENFDCRIINKKTLVNFSKFDMFIFTTFGNSPKFNNCPENRSFVKEKGSTFINNNDCKYKIKNFMKLLSKKLEKSKVEKCVFCSPYCDAQDAL